MKNTQSVGSIRYAGRESISKYGCKFIDSSLLRSCRVFWTVAPNYQIIEIVRLSCSHAVGPAVHTLRIVDLGGLLESSNGFRDGTAFADVIVRNLLYFGGMVLCSDCTRNSSVLVVVVVIIAAKHHRLFDLCSEIMRIDRTRDSDILVVVIVTC